MVLKLYAHLPRILSEQSLSLLFDLMYQAAERQRKTV